MVSKEDIENVKRYEGILNKQLELIEKLDKTIDEFKSNKEEYIKLRDYYNSKEYFEDLDKDRNGEYPEDLPRGIFSEDAVFDLFGEMFNIGIKMTETGLDTIKNY